MSHKPSDTPAPDPATHHPAPVDMAEESVAGEEDPGASLDTVVEPPPDRGDSTNRPAP